MSTAEKKKVRIGFVGVGGMGQAAHLRNYAALPDECEVVAVAEIRPEARKRVAARYGIPRTYESHEELLAKEEIDAVVASQPYSRHGILIPELAKRGVPIMSEKPLSCSIEVGEKIVAALEKNKTWHMVGYHKRSDPATVYAKAEIDRLRKTGEQGELRLLRITIPEGDWIAGGFNEVIHTSDPGQNLEFDPKPKDMNEETFKIYDFFVNYYIHQVNLMRHLLGEDYKVTYADKGGRLLVGESASGVPCTIELSPYKQRYGWDESALAAFEKGYVKLGLGAPLVHNRPGTVEILNDKHDGSPAIKTSPVLPPVDAMRNQALNFIKAVRGEAPAPCLAQEALQDLRLSREYIRLRLGV